MATRKIDENKIAIFGLSNQHQLATLVANKLKARLTKIDKTVFADGEILIKSTQTVRITEKYKEAVLSNLSANERAIFTDNSITIVPSVSTRANTGVNKFVWTWKGFDVYLDHNICSMVVNGGSVATALAAFIPDPTISKVVAVALAAVSSLIAYNDHGKGVIVAFLVIPGQTPVPHWISSQW